MALTRPTLNQINTTITALNDPLTVINKSATSANQDVGFVFNRDSGSTANVAVIWDETNDQFALVTTSSSGATNANVTISDYADLKVGSAFVEDVLRIDQNASGLRMTNVGAFDNDGSDNFRIFATNDLIISANGQNGTAITIDATNQDVAVSNDLTVAGTATVTGTITTGNIVPSANVTYDLGSPTMWWNDLYLSGGTIFLGGLEIKDEGGEVKFKKRGTDEIAKIADVTSSVNAIGGGTSNLAVHSDGAIRANVGGVDVFSIHNTGIVPAINSDGTTGFSLGSESYAWKDIYVSSGSLYVNGQKVLQEEAGTIVVSADEDQNINISTTGTGDVELNPGGSIQLKGNVVLTAGKTISQAGGAAAEFSAGVKADSVTARTTNTSLTLSGNGTGVVDVNDSLTVANDVTVTGNLTVNGATTTVSSTNTEIEDALLLLADGQSGAPTKDAGFVVERGSSTNVAWLWDESADEFVAITTSDDATTVGDVGITTYANVHASYFLGDGSQLTGLPETYGNTEVLAYLTDNSYTTETYVNTANTNMGGYVDNAVSTANVNLKGYTDGQLASYATTSALTTANTNVVGYVDGAVSTANVNLKGYVDSEITAIGAHYSNTDVAAYLTTNNYATESYADTANVNLKGYSDATFATQSSATTANTNVVGYVDGEITTVNSAITTANTNVVGYVDGEITTVNSTITTANTNVVGYVDNAVSTANVNLKGYSDATFLTSYTETNDLSASVTWANIPDANVPESAVTQHQAALGITESQISDLGTYATASELSTANVNLKGYTDATFETQSSATTANTNVVGYVDGAVSTANINLKGYTDGQLASYATTSALTTANTNLKGYTDGEITTVTSAIGTANTNMQGYVDNEISSLIDSAPGTLDTLNEIAAALGDDPNLATTLTNTITTANTNMKGYVDGQVSTLNSSITTANTNVVGYVDSAVSTANVNLKGYADATFLTSYTETNDLTSAVTWTNIPDANVPESAVTQHQAALSVTESQISDLGTYTTASDISTANVNLKGYADATFQTQTAASTANVNLKGYTDGEITTTTSAIGTANVNLKGYVDATFAQQTLTADIDADDTYTIINLVDPVSAQDAVTLAYLESSLSSDVTAILNDDTSVEVNDNGVNPGNIGFVVDDSIVGNITASGLTLTGVVTTSGNIETTGGEVNVKARGQVRFFESDNGQFVALRAPSTVASNVTFNLPASDGTSGQVIQTDGAGSLTFVDAASGGGGGGTGGFFTSTITTHPAAGGDEDLATGPSDDTLETPFDTGGTDEFGVSMGILYDQMEPQGQYITVDLGDEEAYVGA
jgi:hypothetical protein